MRTKIHTFCTCISVRKDSIVILCWFSSSRYMSLSWRHSSSSADETCVSDAFSPIVPSFRPAISLSLDYKGNIFSLCPFMHCYVNYNILARAIIQISCPKSLNVTFFNIQKRFVRFVFVHN